MSRSNSASQSRLFEVAPTSTVLAMLYFLASFNSAAVSQEATTSGTAVVENIEQMEMVRRIDQWIDQRLTEEGWQPAGPCVDAAFFRRSYLDLTGSPPKSGDILDFIEDNDPRKREMLVQRLVRSPGYAEHLSSIWANWLVNTEGDNPFLGQQDGLRNWLRDRFRENLRYDRLIADLLVATGSVQSGPVAFFVSLEGKPEKVAAQTARVFMGVQLDCAECHDHPFDRWKQEDFWGLAAYFSQMTPVGESGMNAPEIFDTNTGEVMIPGTEQIVPPRPLVQSSQAGKALGTRRQQLTLWLTTRENPFLARAAVNRIWAILMGRGLVEPVDDMRDTIEASHPELLHELSEYFAQSGYDVRKLFETICLTQAYSRDTQHPSGLPPEGLYAVMETKPLTERQLANCVAEVARQLGQPNRQTQDALASQLGKLRGEASQIKVGIVNALVTLHGDLLDQASSESSSRLLQALQAPHLDGRGQIRWLYLSTLNRLPTMHEMQRLSEYLSGIHDAVAGDEPTSETDESNQSETTASETNASVSKSLVWQSDLLWALLNSTEFAMTP